MTDWIERAERLLASHPAVVRVTLVAPGADLRMDGVGRLGSEAWYGKEAPSVRSSGVGRDRSLVVLLDGNLRRGREVASVPDLITGSVTMADQVATRFVPFSPRALHAHSGPCFYVMASDEPRVAVFRADGSQAASASAPAAWKLS